MYESSNPIAIRSKQIITETLLNLMKEFPFEEITVKLILLESGLSRKTFYRNFESKEDVLDSFIRQKMNEYAARLLIRQYTNFASIIDVIFEFCEEYKELFILLDKHDLLMRLLKIGNEVMPEHHRRFTTFEGEEDPMVEYILFFNTGCLFNVLFKWVKDGMKIPASVIRDGIMAYISNISNINLTTI